MRYFFSLRKGEASLELKINLLTLENTEENILWEYLTFCRVFDEKKTGVKTEEGFLVAIRETLSFCKDNNILKEYLTKKKKEVEDFMLEIFTEEELEECDRNMKRGKEKSSLRVVRKSEKRVEKEKRQKM